jgi:hypothetical protein
MKAELHQFRGRLSDKFSISVIKTSSGPKISSHRLIFDVCRRRQHLHVGSINHQQTIEIRDKNSEKEEKRNFPSRRESSGEFPRDLAVQATPTPLPSFLNCSSAGYFSIFGRRYRFRLSANVLNAKPNERNEKSRRDKNKSSARGRVEFFVIFVALSQRNCRHKSSWPL